MRRIDKLKNIQRVNRLLESRSRYGSEFGDGGEFDNAEQQGQEDFYDNINNSEKKLKEAPMFGGEKVSQDQHDELQYDKQNMEKAMGDTFKTPEGYEMKNYIEIGGTYPTEDGDMVKVIGETPDGGIKVILTHGEDTIQQYNKWGLPAPKPLNITWSKVQFDTIMGQMDDYNDSQYRGERHGY